MTAKQRRALLKKNLAKMTDAELYRFAGEATKDGKTESVLLAMTEARRRHTRR